MIYADAKLSLVFEFLEMDLKKVCLFGAAGASLCVCVASHISLNLAINSSWTQEVKTRFRCSKLLPKANHFKWIA